jgi:hypothetical protein
MERADRSLASVVTSRPRYDVPTAFDVYGGICAGVKHIHDNDIIHRDLKPANVLLFGATPKIADFGLCLLTGSAQRMTPPWEGVGPRFYMAPELEDGRNLDVTIAADIYSLGKMLYFILSGGMKFSREKQVTPAYNLAALLHDARYDVFRPIWNKTITPTPRDRFNSMSEFIHAITRARQEFSDHPRTRLHLTWRPVSHVGAASSAATIRQLSADESDELALLFADSSENPDADILMVLAKQITSKGVPAFVRLMERCEDIDDLRLARIGEHLYEDETRATAVALRRQVQAFDTRLDSAVLEFSESLFAKENLVRWKLSRAASERPLVLRALRQYEQWNEPPRTALLERCAYGEIDAEIEAELIEVSRRKDVSPTQLMFLSAALAHQGSDAAVERLIAIGQEFPDRAPDAESSAGRRIQGFVGGLLLRPNRMVLERLTQVEWHSRLLTTGLNIAASSTQSRQLSDDGEEESGGPEET